MKFTTETIATKIITVIVAIVSTIIIAHSFGANHYTGDILINYNGGYVRRGFIGSILYALSKAGNISPDILVIGLYSVCKIVIVVLAILLIKRDKVSAILLFSYPLLLNGFINSNGRIDFVLLLLFVIVAIN